MNEAKNRRIAEALEPSPTWIKTCTGGDELIISTGGAWTCPERCIRGDGYADGCEKARPRDFYTDEAANALVRDRLFKEVDTPELREICGEDEYVRLQRGIYWKVARGLDCDVSIGSLVREAIAEAFLKWIDSLQNIPEHLRSAE